MADSPCGPPEYGAATSANDPVIDASFSNPNFTSSWTAPSQLLAESNSDFILSQDQLDHDYFTLEAFELLSPPAAHEIVSNGSGTSSTPSRPPAQPLASTWLQPSTTCNYLQAQVCERSPSRTIFVDPPPPPLKVVQLQCLPGPAENMAYIDGAPHDPSCDTRSHLILHPFRGDFSFHPTPIYNPEPFDDVRTAVSNYMPNYQASASYVLPLASDYMPPASAMDTHNHPYADAARTSVDKIPKLVDVQGGPSQYLQQAMGYPYINHSCLGSIAKSPMESCMGAFSDSAAMEFSTTPTTSASLTYIGQTNSMADFVGVSISAPVSPTPSVNKGAPFHIVEDTGSAPVGGNQVQDGPPCKTEFYKRLDKFAWRKHHGFAQGGVKKRRNYSRRASVSGATDRDTVPLPQHSSSENATGRITEPAEHMRRLSNEKDNTVRNTIRVKTEKLNLDDGYRWRKYGEKFIKGEKFSRNYLKCEESGRSSKCTVVKHTQRCSDDEDYVHFLYIGRHNHPAARPS